MLQFKLFKVFGGDEEFNKIILVFPNAVKFNDNIVGIPYDYGRNGYRKILEEVKGFSVKQYIITPEKFFKLINLSVNNDYFISSLKFLDSVPLENQQVMDLYRKQINTAQTNTEKLEKLDKYLSELEWIVSDGSIDIKELGLRIMSNNKQLQVEVTLYNNGVILIDNKDVENQVIELIKSIE